MSLRACDEIWPAKYLFGGIFFSCKILFPFAINWTIFFHRCKSLKIQTSTGCQNVYESKDIKLLCFSKSALGNSASGWKIMYSSVNSFGVLDTRKLDLPFDLRKSQKTAWQILHSRTHLTCSGTCGTKHFCWCHFEWKDSYLKPSSSSPFHLTIVTKKIFTSVNSTA